jgi:hypothetical protein
MGNNYNLASRRGVPRAVAGAAALALAIALPSACKSAGADKTEKCQDSAHSFTVVELYDVVKGLLDAGDDARQQLDVDVKNGIAQHNVPSGDNFDVAVVLTEGKALSDGTAKEDVSKLVAKIPAMLDVDGHTFDSSISNNEAVFSAPIQPDGTRYTDGAAIISFNAWDMCAKA